MDRRPATKPGPDLRQADTGRDDSFDTATDGDGFARLDTGVTGMTGSSIDTLHELGLPAQALAGESEDAELDEPVPNAERLVAQAVALAGDDQDAATLVGRFWRFAPDEELIGFTAEEMLDAARAHRDLAQQRVPGELKLRIHEPDADQHHTVIEIVTDDMPFLVDSVTALLNRHAPRHAPAGPPAGGGPPGAAGPALTEVCADVEPDDAVAGDLVETWMHIEIDRGARPGRAGAGSRKPSCSRVLHRRARGRRGLAEDAPAGPGARRRAGRRAHLGQPAAGAGEGHHRLGGAAALAGATTTSPSSATASTASSTPTAPTVARPCEAVPGTGLGILRSDSPQRPGTRPR